MSQSVISVALMLVLLVCLPFFLRWLKHHLPALGMRDVQGQSRFISALAVGPQQRIVTVEVGPEGARIWLILGVTAQHISCLHHVPVNSGASGASEPVGQQALMQI